MRSGIPTSLVNLSHSLNKDLSIYATHLRSCDQSEWEKWESESCVEDRGGGIDEGRGEEGSTAVDAIGSAVPVGVKDVQVSQLGGGVDGDGECECKEGKEGEKNWQAMHHDDNDLESSVYEIWFNNSERLR
jgi:hypothetical protein